MTILATPPPATTARPETVSLTARRPWLGTVAWAAYAFAAWVCLLSFPHGLPVPTLDLSWSAVVTQAAAEHWRFGPQIMLNYGPLAHLGIAFYHPDLFAANYLFQLCAKLVMVALICRTSRALPTGGRLPFLLVNVLVGMLDWEAIHLWMIVYTGWLLTEDHTRRGRLLACGGLALAAAASLMKGYFFVFSAAVLGCVFVRELWRAKGKAAGWRDGAVPAGVFGVFYVAAWCCAGQRMDDLWTFLRGSFQLMDGYSRAIGYDAAPGVFWPGLLIVAWLTAVAVGALIHGRAWRRPASLPLAALYAGTVFLSWKEGFTRADSFHVSGFLCDAGIAVVALPLFLDGWPMRPATYYGGIAAVWGLAACTLVAPQMSSGRALLESLRVRPARNLSVLVQPDAERDRLDREVAEVRRAFAMPKVRAAVGRARLDVFGTSQARALLNGLNYAPTPILQSYMAYTPFLAGLAARAYLPENAPEFVLYQGGSIDRRLPCLDGAELGREVLWNYDPVLMEDGCLLLRRKPANLQVRTQPTLRHSGNLPLGQSLDVPADGADWCELEVHETFWGRLLNTLYHQTPPVLECTTLDGKRAFWQMPTVMARGGFLLRNGPRTWDDVACLLLGRPVANPVVAIRVVDNPVARRSYGAGVTYRFYHLDPAKPSVPVKAP